MNPEVPEKQCPQCGEKISGEEAICPHCGTRLRAAPVGEPADVKFCPECGSALGGQGFGEEGGRQAAGKRKAGFWIGMPLLILAGICLVVVFFSLRDIPVDQLAFHVVTRAAMGRPTRTPTLTPKPTQTTTPLPTGTPTSTPPPMPPAQDTPKANWTSPVDGMVLVYIPAGRYWIGSLDSDPQAWIAEKPHHPVDLSGYWMDKTEVTNAMYARCIQAGACPAKTMKRSYTRDSYYGNPEFDNYPVIYVTWQEAQDYCAWAGGRLPTEAEWEAAARGRDAFMYPWGNKPPNCSLAVFGGHGWPQYCAGADTAPVGMAPQGASPFGLLDMAGNVWEWVADWIGPNYVIEPVQDPQGAVSGKVRGIRGGAWYDETKFIRSAIRGRHDPQEQTADIGFRCVR